MQNETITTKTPSIQRKTIRLTCQQMKRVQSNFCGSGVTFGSDFPGCTTHMLSWLNMVSNLKLGHLLANLLTPVLSIRKIKFNESYVL